ncbi:MAG: class I SAM-dependent methyltransferase [Solirubrobacterales bacterium]|nr:class I SAM-dependent methyltransferase [Solirubrobacterales bacterium]
MSLPPLTPLATAVLEVGTPERLLEFECGDGEATLFLSREFPRARVRGVDPSERLVRAAQGRVGLDPEGRVAFKVGRAGSLPFPADNFDLVAGLDANPSAAEIARVLRPGGHLILARTSGSTPFPGLSGWLARRRLERHGIELTEPVGVGDGSFSVGRLRRGETAAAAV